MGRAARPLHDSGNHRAIERGSNLQAARRGGLIKPAKPAGERENTAALTPSLGARPLCAGLVRDVLLQRWVTGERSMRQPGSKFAITRDQYDAVLLDLDGVITDTASIHAACWKQMFDEFLQKRATQRGEALRPFDHATDYRLHVDGKPRFDGVRDFLESRGIQLPEGSMDDPPEAETVGGLGNRKNDLINKIIEENGVEPY